MADIFQAALARWGSATPDKTIECVAQEMKLFLRKESEIKRENVTNDMHAIVCRVPDIVKVAMRPTETIVSDISMALASLSQFAEHVTNL